MDFTAVLRGRRGGLLKQNAKFQLLGPRLSQVEVQVGACLVPRRRRGRLGVSRCLLCPFPHIPIFNFSRFPVFPYSPFPFSRFLVVPLSRYRICVYRICDIGS